ncbi:MAG: hypothetical protein GY862_25755 [Gammaproteobacteria bacterium]|nr:hypothetical protein [Gammaproteobacteria bacterium]
MSRKKKKPFATINWHRLFGIALTDFFTDSGYEVKMEKDLSLKQQYLDIVIIERAGSVSQPQPMPDGLDNLSRHNLITYKSRHEPLDDWALDELTGHFTSITANKSALRWTISCLPKISVCMR